MVSIYRDVSSDEQETLRTLSKEENKPIYREKKLINENIENMMRPPLQRETKIL
jgi:hypothetical protein